MKQKSKGKGSGKSQDKGKKASRRELALCVAKQATEQLNVGNVGNKFSKLKAMIQEIMEEMVEDKDLPRGLLRLRQARRQAATLPTGVLAR